ncbi:hypothetical protein BDR03DRAFT_941291 [Suillus americanus]|nr:hypothetical protein BDR03DRAFT_941291 [Suillus americanus]
MLLSSNAFCPRFTNLCSNFSQTILSLAKNPRHSRSFPSAALSWNNFRFFAVTSSSANGTL